jgi:hypothetical protein
MDAIKYVKMAAAAAQAPGFIGRLCASGDPRTDQPVQVAKTNEGE